jgi:hypothetical protein
MMVAYVVTLRQASGTVQVSTWAACPQDAWRQVIASGHVPLSAVVGVEPRSTPA